MPRAVWLVVQSGRSTLVFPLPIVPFRRYFQSTKVKCSNGMGNEMSVCCHLMAENACPGVVYWILRRVSVPVRIKKKAEAGTCGVYRIPHINELDTLFCGLRPSASLKE